MADHQHIAAMLAILRGDRDGYGRARVWRRRRAARHPRRLRRGGVRTRRPDADPVEVARQIVRIVDLLKGQRPFRVHIDPAQDGAERVNDLGDEVRREFYARIGLTDLLSPTQNT
jgi:hypothetical protein